MLLFWLKSRSSVKVTPCTRIELSALTANWVTVKVCPAMVILPALVAPVVLAATERVTVPLPVPLLPEVIVAQLNELIAVHAQLFAKAVTVTLPVLFVEAKDWLVGKIV